MDSDGESILQRLGEYGVMAMERAVATIVFVLVWIVFGYKYYDSLGLWMKYQGHILLAQDSIKAEETKEGGRNKVRDQIISSRNNHKRGL